MKKKFLLPVIAAFLLTSCQQTTSSLYTPGTYEGSAIGYGGEVILNVEVSSNKITNITSENNETPEVGGKAIETMIVQAIETNGEVDAISGATRSSTAFINALEVAIGKAKGEEIILEEEWPKSVFAQLGDPNNVIDLDWSIQPSLGTIKGNYYVESERFRQGHLRILEVVVNDDGEIILVEFNEQTRPNYYVRFYQDMPKRMSEYNFSMGLEKGAAWIQGVIAAENSIIENQSLTDEVDIVSGASNSVKQSMMPLAAKIDARLAEGTTKKFYRHAKDLGGGLTGMLDIVVENGKIIECRYDEIFADYPSEIEDVNLKAYYRQSKYQSITYNEPSRIGFNVQMDALNDYVVETQDMFDLSTLPTIGDTGDYASSGYTTRNTAWDNYLEIAQILYDEMIADGVLY